MDEDMSNVANKYKNYNIDINIITSENDNKVILYRMKKVRNHFECSQLNKRMQDEGNAWILGLTYPIVRRALNGCYNILSLLISPEVGENLLEDIKNCKNLYGPILLANKNLINIITGINLKNLDATGVIVCIPRISFLSIERPYYKSIKIIKNAYDNIKYPMLIMDDVRSADNIGVILRTCFSFGILYVLLSETSAAAINTRSARSSMGALFHITYLITYNVAESIQQLHAQGVQVIGSSPTANDILTSVNTDNWALVIGNEDKGIHENTKKYCSSLVKIPQIEGDSLSVVSATAICLYELSRYKNKLKN